MGLTAGSCACVHVFVCMSMWGYVCVHLPVRMSVFMYSICAFVCVCVGTVL